MNRNTDITVEGLIKLNEGLQEMPSLQKLDLDFGE